MKAGAYQRWMKVLKWPSKIGGTIFAVVFLIGIGLSVRHYSLIDQLEAEKAVECLPLELAMLEAKEAYLAYEVGVTFEQHRDIALYKDWREAEGSYHRCMKTNAVSLSTYKPLERVGVTLLVSGLFTLPFTLLMGISSLFHYIVYGSKEEVLK